MKAVGVTKKKPAPRKRGLLGPKFTAACEAAGACASGLAWLKGRPRTMAELKAHSGAYYVWAVENKILPPEVVTAGYSGTATAGYSGTATAGYSGTATAGDRGTATAGYSGTATAGYSGTVAISGDIGAIVSRWWDSPAARWRMLVGIVGEDGLLPNTKYRAEAGKWVVVP
jgi:hypothetical protein